jgi:cell division protein ZipA
MEQYLGSALLVIFGLIAVLFFLSARSKRPKIEEQDSQPAEPRWTSSNETSFMPDLSQPKTQHFLSQSIPGNLLTISVFAKPHNRFASYDLLQAIAATGMQYGEMNIFHYYQRSKEGKKMILFSLASATKPGCFDLDRIGNFSCIGLTLFMDITQVPNPSQAFYLMVGTAEQLADDLEGELRADPHTLWDDLHFQACEQKIMQAQVESVP